MKIFVEVRESQTVYSDYESKLNEILSHLTTQSEIEKQHFLRTLASSLITPDSFLLSLPSYKAAALLAKFFTFIKKRQSTIAIDCLPFPEENSALVLIGAPDAAYHIDSLQTLQESHRLLPFQVMVHRVLVIKRRGGEIIHLGTAGESGPKEAFIILKQEEATEKYLQKLTAALQKVFTNALRVQQDTKALTARLHKLEQIATFDSWKSFLSWLQRGAFIPLAYYCFDVNRRANKELDIQALDQERLGLAPEDLLEGKGISVTPHALLTAVCHPEEILRELPLLVQRTPLQSFLHRADPLIYIGLQESLKKGKYREHAFLGLFSKAALIGATLNIPELHLKVAQILESLHLPPGGHEYAKLSEFFNLFPPVELFFMGEVQLQLIARSLLSFLHRADSIKLLILASASPTRIAALLLIPRQLFAAENISKIEAYLCRELAANLEISRIIRRAGSSYVGLHLTLRPSPEEVHIDINRLESKLTQIAKPWEYKFRWLLEQALGKEREDVLWNKYRHGFSPGYRALTSPSAAVQDVQGLEQVLQTEEEIIDLQDSDEDLPAEHYRLQFYSCRESFLDELMPVLENLGLRIIDQVRFSIKVENRGLFIKSFFIKVARNDAKPIPSLRPNLLAALTALFRGHLENDPLNELLVLTGLSWEEIDIFRGYRNYYFQLGTPFTPSRFHQALSHNPQVAFLLCRYFKARFRPESQWNGLLEREEKELLPIRTELAEALQTVINVNEDRILRTLFNLIDATVRTNFYRRQTQKDYFFSFKVNSLGVIEMPTPRPLYEIYVHSATMEGIHLRGGRVARGGIRWSDRPDDFRTEILGLMQTQMMKNALIVPVGAKGGFIVKTPFSTRKEGARLAQEAYITFIQGLLDLTDNREGTAIARPRQVVAYDEDDPYLVVAADKGTAHLPDIANETAEEYRFWLGNAFASGGSHGYHHKKLGITARGAWECVKRHFRELEQDIQAKPFTVVGIGSMDGDVFGNGMLLSRQIRLLAAFGAEHIFIDPDPDPEVAYKERKRLFELPGSSWNDYDRATISEGGGIYSRQVKDIPLSPQVRHWLGIRHRFLDSEGLIRFLLAAPVDLLWLGGIGTYIKASTERQSDVGDRANDSVRIDATQLQARVVGEGANLGLTQRGRIEYALGGGHINTDAVDNSGGVDLSDHEVNLKILFNALSAREDLATEAQQYAWLAKVTDEVCQKVLANNYSQSLCLSLDQERSRQDTEPFMVLADHLENTGLLNRSTDAFPHRREILARHDKSLTRPELAVLMAYSKMLLYHLLLEQPNFLSSPYLQEFIADYFPAAIRRQFRDRVYAHPLAKEITATVLSNRIINQASCTFLTRVEELNPAAISASIAAYLAFDKVLAGKELRAQVYRLDNVVPAARQYDLLLQLEDTLAHFCYWTFNQVQPLAPDTATLSILSDYLAQYTQYQEENLSEDEKQRFTEIITRLQQEGFSPKLSRQIALFNRLLDFPVLVDLATTSGKIFTAVVRIYEAVANYLGYPKIQELLNRIPMRDQWEHRAKISLEKSFKSHLGRLTLDMLEASEHKVTAFFTTPKQQQRLLNYQRIHRELRETSPTGFLPFTVLIGKLETLTRK